MPFRVRRKRIADPEFYSMPSPVRETFIAAFRELAASRTPLASGPGWYVAELRQNQRIAPEGLYSVHVGPLYRGAFFRRRTDLVFLSFGYRYPEFYVKLRRLREAVAESEAMDRDREGPEESRPG